VRLSREPRAIDDLDLDDRVAFPLHEGWQEAVQGIEERQRQEHVAAEGLVAAGGVRRVVLQDGPAHGVGDPRLQLLERTVAASEASADRERHARPACLQGSHEFRHIARVVLPIAVERRHDVGAGRPDPGQDGGALAATLRVPETRSQGRAARASSERLSSLDPSTT
jgi:hypothetical protein